MQRNSSEESPSTKLIWFCWCGDGTILRIYHPKINQDIVYNGHKLVHGIKFQSLALPTGGTGNLSGPYVGKLHDSHHVTQV